MSNSPPRESDISAPQSGAVFRTTYAYDKVDDCWCDEIDKLSECAKTQPQAAYDVFCHGEVPGMKCYLQPLDGKINNNFLPSLLESLNRARPTTVFITSPSWRLGDTYTVRSEIKDQQYNSSERIAALLVSTLILEEHSVPDEKQVHEIKIEEKK